MKGATNLEKENCPLYPFYKDKTDDVCDENRSENIAVKARYKNANIPSEYRDVYVSNSVVRNAQPEMYKLLDVYIKTFSNSGIQIKNLYLYSTETGTGKTTTAIALLSEYIRRRFLYYVKNGQRVPENIAYFLDLNEIQTRYNLATMSSNQEELRNIADEIAFCQTIEFLVVDDVGVRSVTESFRTLIHSVVNARVSNKLPTVYTSNVAMEDLNEIFDQRVYDRIRDQTQVFTFGGESKRGKR